MADDMPYPAFKQGYHRVLPDNRLHDQGSDAQKCACRMAITRSSMIALTNEVIAARQKFPASRYMLTAIAEELGELARAVLQRRPVTDVRREALQVACTAMRLYEEGDPIYDSVTEVESQP